MYLHFNFFFTECHYMNLEQGGVNHICSPSCSLVTFSWLVCPSFSSYKSSNSLVWGKHSYWLHWFEFSSLLAQIRIHINMVILITWSSPLSYVCLQFYSIDSRMLTPHWLYFFGSSLLGVIIIYEPGAKVMVGALATLVVLVTWSAPLSEDNPRGAAAMRTGTRHTGGRHGFKFRPKSG